MKKLNILFLEKEKSRNNINISDIGNNYGNLLFYEATLKLFKEHLIHFNSFSKPDLVVITTANTISNNTSNIGYINYLSNNLKNILVKK